MQQHLFIVFVFYNLNIEIIGIINTNITMFNNKLSSIKRSFLVLSNDGPHRFSRLLTQMNKLVMLTC